MNSDCQLISRMELEKMNQNKIDCCPISNSFGGSMRVNSMLQNAHDIDSRFAGNINKSSTETQGQKKLSMVANLYLPIIAICLDNLPKVTITF